MASMHLKNAASLSVKSTATNFSMTPCSTRPLLQLQRKEERHT